MQFRHPDLNQVLALADEAATWQPTYDGPEPNGSEPAPLGFRRHSYCRPLGIGADVFARAELALRDWSAHLGAGMEVVPVDAPIAVGQNVIVVARLWPFSVVAGCRITATEITTTTFGFTYATLKGHPECGKETFRIVRDEIDQVRFEISSISRADDRLARLAGPISRAIQRRMTGRYLDGLAEAVAPR